MNRAALAALSAGLAVAAGAFGAHALRTRMEPSLLAVFETAVRYQLAHALAVLALEAHVPGRPQLARASRLMLLGTVAFSGSLYALSLTGVRALGMITPLGGALWLAAWCMAVKGLAGGPGTGDGRGTG